jgi:tetratricopeptide (TPR) repeat protein
MEKAPLDARPVCNLAIQLAWSKNPTNAQYEVALAMFKKALTLNMAQNFLITDIINNIGNIYYNRGQYQQAVNVYKRGIRIDPDFLKMRYDLISSLIMLGEWKEGLKHANVLIENKKNYIEPDYYKLKGFILLWQNRLDEALENFRKALKMEPDNKAVLLNTGVALSRMGATANANLFFHRGIKLAPKDIRPFFAIIENSAREGDNKKTENYVNRLFEKFSLMSILGGIEFFSNSYRTAPMSSDIFIPFIRKKILQYSDGLTHLHRSAIDYSLNRDP